MTKIEAKRKRYTYLEKGITKMFMRKDKKVLTIRITNESDKRLKISIDIENKLNKILKELFFDNGEYII